jgi:predicted dehydrogenase
MQVGVQSTANPIWSHAYDQIKNGKIGKVVHAQTHYYRNSDVGQWRYYRLDPSMTPSNINWDMFLGTQFGLAPKVPFDRARFAQWRCYWDYGGGMFTDLFVHRITRIMKTLGLREPRRVVGAGGIYLEYDTRDVPDVSTIVADFDEGCQVMVTACMTNDHQIEECVRGHLGTIVLDESSGYDIIPQKISSGPKASFEKSKAEGRETIKPEGVLKGDMTYQHWENFLECIRNNSPDKLNNPADLGAAAYTFVQMGVQSYREGKALFFNRDTKQVSNADASWALQWEKRSHSRGEPTQIPGWNAGVTGSKLFPNDYQQLEGPWVNGVDPAAKGNAAN